MSAGKFATPEGWARHPGDRFVLHQDPLGESPLSFALSVAAGLDERPRRLDAKFLYDQEGCLIFDQITRQPEYYQTRTEDALLKRHAPAIRAQVGDVALVELGSGTSEKTRRLLDAWCSCGPVRYAPIDVSRPTLEAAGAALARAYPNLTIEAVAASYQRALPLIPQLSPLLLAFLGSSIGNLGMQGEHEFLANVAQSLRPGDWFLVGLDQAHDPDLLEAAYNDAAQFSAAFTRNLFARMNSELGTEVPLDLVEHVAFYDASRERIEIFAQFRERVQIELPRIGRSFRIARGERILTEVSQKYRPPHDAVFERHGLSLAFSTEDERGRFGLRLYRRRAQRARRASERARDCDLLARVRRRTLDIIAPVPEAILTGQHSRLMSPIVWDLGHIANFEQVWLGRRLAAQAEAGPSASARFLEEGLDPSYDPARTARDKRAELPLPALPAARAYLERARAESVRVLEALAGRAPPLLERGYVVHMVAQHEAQHQETILQALNLREDLRYQPAYLDERPNVEVRRLIAQVFLDERPNVEIILPPARVFVPGGPFKMGTDDRSRAYDNERPAHWVELPSFWIDAAPISNAQYLAFLEDGGYRRRELWTEHGWQWRVSEGAEAPWGFRREEGRWMCTAFGEVAPIDPRCPVVHVSWYEADAYARWAGKRLPSEAEWEKAAGWDPGRGALRHCPWGDEPPDPERANLDQRRLCPAPIGTFPAGRSPYGCVQMLGDVWEWTASWFGPYPGFQSYPYREYSEVFFGSTYRVLRGGSFATSALVARNTFRNWDYPQRRQIFAGFRCAEDA